MSVVCEALQQFEVHSGGTDLDVGVEELRMRVDDGACEDVAVLGTVQDSAQRSKFAR
jgi:hypothetical protein